MKVRVFVAAGTKQPGICIGLNCFDELTLLASRLAARKSGSNLACFRIGIFCATRPNFSDCLYPQLGESKLLWRSTHFAILGLRMSSRQLPPGR